MARGLHGPWLGHHAAARFLQTRWVWQRDYSSHSEAIQKAADYIVNFCNSMQLRPKLSNLSSDAFEKNRQPNSVVEVSEIT